MSIHRRVQQPTFPGAANEAWVSVIVAADHLTQTLEERVFRPRGITGDQYNVLRILRGAGRGGLARGEITRRLMRRSPDTTRLLDRLERNGLIRRDRDPDDGRLSVAHITKDGLALLRDTDPEMDRVVQDSTAPLSAAELRELVRLCSALVP